MEMTTFVFVFVSDQRDGQCCSGCLEYKAIIGIKNVDLVSVGWVAGWMDGSPLFSGLRQHLYWF